MFRRAFAMLTGATILAAAALVATPQAASAAPVTRVLVFSKTAGFRHSSIPNGIAAIQQLGAANGFTVTATEDAGQFTTANLAQYQVVVWLSTTGDVLNADAADRVPVLHRERRWLRRRPRGRRHRVRLAVVRRARRRVLRTPTRPSSRPRCGSRTDQRVDRPPPGELGPHRRVVQLPHQPAAQRARAAEPRRGRPTAAATWATTRSPGARTTAADAPGTPGSGHTEQSLHRQQLHPHAARRHPDRRRRRDRGLHAAQPRPSRPAPRSARPGQQPLRHRGQRAADRQHAPRSAPPAVRRGRPRRRQRRAAGQGQRAVRRAPRTPAPPR